MSKWIGKGVLTVDGKDIGYGEEIPASLDKDKLRELIKAGNVGDIPEKIDPKVLETDAIKDLEKDNSGLKKKVASLQEKNAGLGKIVEGLNGGLAEHKEMVISLEKDKTELLKANEAFSKKIAKLEK